MGTSEASRVQVIRPGHTYLGNQDSPAAPCTWLVVHSAGSDQEGIVVMPELDAILT
jgi:uncharacterized RmlC-like cupin family protein